MIKRVKDLLGMSSTDAHAAPTRLVTSPEPPRPQAPKPPALQEDPRTAPSARSVVATRSEQQRLRSERVSEEPSRAHDVTPGQPKGEAFTAHPTDVFEQLGQALENLDERLSGSSTIAASTMNQTPPDSDASAAVSLPMSEPTRGAMGPEQPVFEMDEEWFGGNLARATSARGSASGASPVADTFHALLAAEQAAASQSGSLAAVPGGISDDVIERIATRVAERLSEGVFLETVRNVVESVAERLVREEITRIRTRMNEQKQ